MCGIVGYVGNRPAVDVLIKGLKRLEYRGYDSTGVAFFLDERLEIKKSEGKLQNVEKLLNGATESFAASKCGIGHTRWATHGKPTTQNAHPHRTGHVVIVHNGIIENYQEIKRELMSRGHAPASETDSELFGFLVFEEMERGQKLPAAVRAAFAQLKGSCSVVVMSEREPGVIVGVRNGSPLAAAVDPSGGAILASDAQPLLEYTREIYFLEDGDMIVGTTKGIEFSNVSDGKVTKRKSVTLDWSPDKLDKQGFEHYMLKEIYEQPSALIDTLNGLLDRTSSEPFHFADQPGLDILAKATDITLIACGTSWHASLLGKYWLERWARIPVRVELASEFRYSDPVLSKGSVVIGVSQSGETADTLAVIRDLKKKGIRTLAITNVRGSTISREADATFFTSAGPEIGVAATKTFLSQILVLLLWSGRLAMGRGHDMSGLYEDVLKLPHVLTDYLAESGPMIGEVKRIAREVQDLKGFFFIGRGHSFPIALEGALKLKEIAYVHAEGYAAGELKHGPIAMIDEQMAVVVLAPQDSWREKTVSNLEEVKARGARIIGIGSGGDEALRSLCDFWVPLPESFEPSSPRCLEDSLLPFVMTPLVQLLSYELAVLKGTDVDKPRNLAKSVTVE